MAHRESDSTDELIEEFRQGTGRLAAMADDVDFVWDSNPPGGSPTRSQHVPA